MKRLLLPTFLLFAVSVTAQMKPAPNEVDKFISEFRLIGKQGTTLYFLNPVRVERNGNVVGFFGFVYKDRSNYLLSRIKIDCLGFKFRVFESWAVFAGEKKYKDDPGPLESIPTGSAIAGAHKLLCGDMV